jgi:hypothetical protein
VNISMHIIPSEYPQFRCQIGAKKESLKQALCVKQLKSLAGAPGFEPGDGGIKIRPHSRYRAELPQPTRSRCSVKISGGTRSLIRILSGADFA